MKKWTFTLRTLGLLTGGLLLTGSASAALQNYPGASCVSASSTPLTVFSAGDAGNVSASTMTLVCPIVRDMSTFSTGNASGAIWVLDEHFTANVCCSSQVLDPIGSLHATASQCTTGSGTVTGLSFSGPVWTGTFGARSYMCTLPPQFASGTTLNTSTVRAYRSGEL